MASQNTKAEQDNTESAVADDQQTATEPEEQATPEPENTGDSKKDTEEEKSVLEGYDSQDEEKDTEGGKKPEDSKEAESREENPDDSADAEGEEDKETPEGAPEQYEDFSLPEGYQMDEEVQGKFASMAKERGLDQEQAQGFVDLAAEVVQKQQDALIEQHKQTVQGWMSELKKDPNFDENVERVQRAFRNFGDKDLFEVCEHYGLSNHPAFNRLLVKVDKATSEKALIEGNPPSSDPLSPEEVFYGKD